MPSRPLRLLAKIAGSFALAGAALWAASANYHGGPRSLLLEERNLARFRSSHYEILYDPARFTRQRIEAFAAERERILAAEAARLRLDRNSVHLRVILYSDFDAERAATGKPDPYSVDGTTIRAVLAGHLKQLDPAADAAAMLDGVWGPPGSPLLGKWGAAWLAAEPTKSDVAKAAAEIEAEIGHSALAELVARNSDGFLSPLVRTPLGAAWIEWVFERPGLAAVEAVYQARDNREDLGTLAGALGTTPQELEAAWQQWTTRLQASFLPPTSSRRNLGMDFFFRGISLSHEGWRGHGGGYVSQQAAHQMRLLHETGVNAIALVPYGFVPNLNEANIPYTMTDESDVDLSEAEYVAHQLGMKVMLKPQLWVRRGYTGQMGGSETPTRREWMRSYREFILHYARLAEEQEFDLLSIGNELEGLTPDEADWRSLIADVRRVYHGPITYAANWGREFDSVRFWDALDYAGLNNYYPLAGTPSARADDLQAGAEALAKKLAAFYQRWHRPVLFTEIGYPSVHGAAVEPWVEDAGRRVSLDEQAACYEAIFRVFPGQPWFRGMFWWKWPSDGRGGRLGDASYTPLGKPAAEVVRLWYTRLMNHSADRRTAHP